MEKNIFWSLLWSLQKILEFPLIIKAHEKNFENKNTLHNKTTMPLKKFFSEL